MLICHNCAREFQGKNELARHKTLAKCSDESLKVEAVKEKQTRKPKEKTGE